MNNLIFIPILKNNGVSEPKALDKCKDLFSDKCIPYIEIFKEKPEKESKRSAYYKTKAQVEDVLHFEEYHRKTYSDLENVIILSKSINDQNIIVSLHIKNQNELNKNINKIKDFINYEHKIKQKCAIRIPVSFKDTTNLKEISETLIKDDYLIFDIREDKYESLTLFFDNVISNFDTKCKIIIFSDERPISLANKNLALDDYNINFNTSIIESIKKESFNFDGFGSYCSARNNTTTSGSRDEIYGVFVIYNYEKNNFFSYKTDTDDFQEIAYKKLQEKVLKSSYWKGAFKATTISLDMLNKLLNYGNSKQATDYITISIIHHIEEINNNLLT